MLNEKEKLELITQISLDINEVKDIDLLLERILTCARKVFNADAGSIYLKEGDQLRFAYSQNNSLQRRLNPGKKLIYNTFTMAVNNDSIAGYVAKNRKIVNIPDVYEMSDLVPYTFDSDYDIISDYRTCSMLTVPMCNQHGDVLGVMQIINALNDEGHTVPFSASDEALIMHFAISAALAVDRAQMTRNIILRMIRMARLRDPSETDAHVNRVAAYSVEIFEEWARSKRINIGQMEKQKDLLRMAAMLHDVGKVAISDLILKKPDRLTVDEFEIMKSHTYLGARLFLDFKSDFEEVAAEVALNHHERWDGTGYPGYINLSSAMPLVNDGANRNTPRPKRGEEIPLFGRIVAIADVYDALCSRRSYKEPWEEDLVLNELQHSSGKHFDPEIVEAFFSCIDAIKFVASRYPDMKEG
jgi:HD-GYP domain-containing protein (c-di-GMP phosphodiesterase class II)